MPSMVHALRQACQYNRRDAYVHLAIQPRHLLPYIRSCQPEQLWAPVLSFPKHPHIWFSSSPFFLYRAKPSYSLCGFVFLPVLLLLYRLVLSGLLNALMPLLFCLGDSSRSRYPVVSLEWSGVSLTEYSLSMHLYIRPSTYRGS